MSAHSKFWVPAVIVATTAALTIGNTARANPDCVPVIVLRGDVEEIGPELRARGLETSGSSPCGQVQVFVEKTADGYLLSWQSETEVVDRKGADPRAAATIIEGWVRSDLADPLLAARPVEPFETVAPDVRIVTLGGDGPTHPPRRLELTAGSDLAVGLDGSTWTGISVAGCVNLHTLCVGGAVRAAVDNRTGGDAERIGAMRYGIDTLFTVDWPLRRERWALYPGLAVGQGFQLVKLDASGDNDELAGVRLRARLGLAISIAESTSIVINPEWVWTPGNPRIVTDIAEEDDEGVPIGSTITYPGDPGMYFRLGLAVRLEAL